MSINFTIFIYERKRRINVSAVFYIIIKFKATYYLVQVVHFLQFFQRINFNLFIKIAFNRLISMKFVETRFVILTDFRIDQ